ncbi:MAG: DUF3551 domain-containing protein [Pseudorhodoplanes sp.]
MRLVTMRLALALAAMVVALAALPPRADAQRYIYDTQYCVRAYDGATDCAYFTLQQCLAAVSATGGDCAVNPRYSGEPGPRRKAPRPYR